MDPSQTNDLLDRCCQDPWNLSPAERQQVLAACREEQACWHPVVTRWVEPPNPTDEFPAFLLALAPFASLRVALQDAELAGGGPCSLDTGIRDQLQHFADSYRDWLNGEVDEDLLLSESERDRLLAEPR